MNIILFFIGFIFFAALISIIRLGSSFNIERLLLFVSKAVFYIGFFIIIINLKRILKSIGDRAPFHSKNILYLRRIGYYILAIGIIDIIISYPKPNYSDISILATTYGSIKPISFFYMILSILAFILSDVFRIAMEIKKENDLTV